MKRILLVLVVFAILFAGCKKKEADTFDPAQQAIIDDAAIQTYIKANNINATRDASGLYYQVIKPGTGAYPTASSTVTVNYTGKLLNGAQFDSGTYTTGLAANSNVIEGWKIGIPHINTGGRLLLIIPSALGYKNTATGSIPANSVLVFTVDLTGIK